jgi:hypothetical protein
MKYLSINNVRYAQYEIEGSTLFMKMIVQIIPGDGNERQSEDLLIHLIQLVEKRNFFTVSHLNV